MMPLAAARTEITAGGAWTPIGESWLTALYVADTGVLNLLGMPCADAELIATWADQSGNGNDATQATIGLRPRFTASDARASGNPSVSSAADDNSRRLVTAPIGFQSLYCVIGYGDGTAGVFDGYERLLGGYSSNGSTDIGGLSGTPNLRTPRLATTVSKGGAAFTNAILPLPLSVCRFQTDEHAGKNWTIANFITGSYPLGGPVVAYMFTNGAEPVAETEGWLAHRFGIQSTLVAGHTYRDSPP